MVEIEQHVLVAEREEVGTLPHFSGVDRVVALDVGGRAFDERMQIGPVAEVGRVV